jgi:hypothetical protein
MPVPYPLQLEVAPAEKVVALRKLGELRERSGILAKIRIVLAILDVLQRAPLLRCLITTHKGIV